MSPKIIKDIPFFFEAVLRGCFDYNLSGLWCIPPRESQTSKLELNEFTLRGSPDVFGNLGRDNIAPEFSFEPLSNPNACGHMCDTFAKNPSG